MVFPGQWLSDFWNKANKLHTCNLSTGEAEAWGSPVCHPQCRDPPTNNPTMPIKMPSSKLEKQYFQLGMAVHTFIPSAQEAGTPLWIWNQHGLHIASSRPGKTTLKKKKKGRKKQKQQRERGRDDNWQLVSVTTVYRWQSQALLLILKPSYHTGLSVITVQQQVARCHLSAATRLYTLFQGHWHIWGL